MSPEFVIGFARQAIEAALMLSLPLLGVSLAIGVVISIIQAATQIQDATLTFVPKMLGMFVALLVAFPWLMDKMVSYTRDLILSIPVVIQ